MSMFSQEHTIVSSMNDVAYRMTHICDDIQMDIEAIHSLIDSENMDSKIKHIVKYEKTAEDSLLAFDAYLIRLITLRRKLGPLDIPE